MVYKTVSSKSIIARVMRDLKPNVTNWLDDAIEWLGDVVEGIGVYNTLEHKTELVEINHHRGTLPCDLESISKLTFQESIGKFSLLTVSNDEASTSVLTSGELLRGETTDLIRRNVPYCYFTAGGIVTSFERGYVLMNYNAFPLDKQGYPLIPDNYYYKQAAFWYIASRLALRQDIKVVSFDKADSEWQTYQRLAANDCAFPSPDQMDRFRDRWARLIPPDHYEDRFDPEILPGL